MVESFTAGTWAWAIGRTVLACIPLGLSLWAFLDAAHRPEWAWALSRHQRVAWMVGILFGALTVVLGLFISLWYLVRVRPKIAAIEGGRFPEDLGRGRGPSRR